jgi:type VI secretion system protein ImpC
LVQPVSHYKLDRIRPPRVQITYDVEVDGEIQMRELPFVAGVLADLSGDAAPTLPSLKDPRRKFVEIDRDNFDYVMRGMRPRLKFMVNNTFTNDERMMSVELEFQSMEDFSPQRIAAQVPMLQECMEARARLIGFRSILNQKGQTILETLLHDQARLDFLRGEHNRGELAKCALVAKVVEEGRMGLTDDEKELAKCWVLEFFRHVLADGLPNEKNEDIVTMVDLYITEIDGRLSGQLNEIMHKQEFQALEAAWRGLHYFVMQTEIGAMLKIRVLNVAKEELWKDLTNAVESDQSALFKKVYEEEFGTFGGAPYGLLVGSYDFSKNGRDIELLEKLSNIAATAHAPFLAAASPDLLGLEEFTKLPTPRDLAKTFDTPHYAKWRSFRESVDSRYVGLTLPRVMLRLPYGPNTVPVEGLNFMEDVDGKDHSKYLWGTAAFVMAAIVTNAFARYGWTAAIRGIEGGGLVDGLPMHTFQDADGEFVLKCPTEVSISDRREGELADLGFIPLIHCKGTDYAAFFGADSCQKSMKYDTDAANANAKLSTQLQYVLAVSRFALYLKVIIRDRIGLFHSRKECELFLNRWISKYVISTAEAGAETKTPFPLKQARVEVVEVQGKPGHYRAVAFLQPHFQLDDLTICLRLVIDLPSVA